MDPVLRRRIAALLLIAGIAVAALAIADVGPFEDPITEEQRARDAVEAVFAAAAGGDSEEFCGLLTPDYRHSLEIQIAQRAQSDEPARCERIIALISVAYQNFELAVSTVSVSGNRARVEARLRFPGHPAEPRTVLLVEEGGSWRVDDLDA